MLNRTFKSSKPAFAVLGEGTHRVRLLNVVEGDSFHQYNGTLKEKEWPWKDACPVLILTFVSDEPGKVGGFTHRAHMLGYEKFDALSDEQKASGLYTDRDGIACTGDDEIGYERVVSEEATEKCDAILNNILFALGIPEGFVPMTCMDENGEVLQSEFPELLASKKLVCEIEIVSDEYNGQKQLKVGKFRRAKITVSDIVVTPEVAEAVEEPAVEEKPAKGKKRQKIDARME